MMYADTYTHAHAHTERDTETEETYHLRPSNQPALNDSNRLDAEPSRVPEDEVGELPDLDAANQVRHALGAGRVDRVLADVPLDAEVVGAGALVLGQGPALDLVLVGRVPGAQDDLAAAAHGLGVAGHHADGAEVVQDVLGGDGLGADARLGEGHVLGDVARQVVADHEHVEVLVERVARVRPRRVRAARQHVLVLHHRDDVGRVPAARALGVVRVDRAARERRDGRLDVPGLVERVRVDEALHVELVAHPQARVDGRRRRAPVLVQLEPALPRQDLLPERPRRAVVALARDADVHRQLVAGLQHLPRVVRAGRAGGRGRAGAAQAGVH